MNKNTKIKVRNRSTGVVSYKIPDMNNFKRTFQPKEEKELPFDEVQKVAFIPGGNFVLQNYLVIENIEARDEVLGAVELEYNYTETDIEKLLISGSMDELLDCLDFAPKGVIDLLKVISVNIELNDMKKREVIQKKTGFNVHNAIKIKRESNEVTEEEGAAPTRRVAAKTEATTETPVRRTVTLKK
jgi:hypothetical protein